ncbi:MAG: polysaccharide deacetylase family protein [Rhodomicrobium sp.]
MLLQPALCAILVSIALSFAAFASDCPANPSALGVSRILPIQPSQYDRLGTVQYGQTLPLQVREIVLTFDDGPLPPYTGKVLDALAFECVKATFFVVGQMAAAYPEMLHRMRLEGHTIGTHTLHHAHLDHIPLDASAKEISGGIATVDRILGEGHTSAPFFRFPYLDPTPGAEAYAIKHGLTIWSADVFVNDWTPISPEQELALAIHRLERKKKGILLLHDIQKRTAEALPSLLAELKRRGFHVVQAVPAAETRPYQFPATN